MASSTLRLLLLFAAIFIGYGIGGPVDSSGNSSVSESGHQATTKTESHTAILTRSSIGRDDPFVFPDELPEPPKRQQALSNKSPSPACPGGENFCETAEGYPEDLISNVLTNRISEFSGMFGNESTLDQDLSIGHKVDPSAEKSLCPSREEEKEIRAAKNIYNEWRYVVNQGNYIQRVRMEICLPAKPGSYCDRINLGFKTECKQKYVEHKLIALNNDSVGPDVFRIPSCCACVLKTDKQNLFLRISDPHPTTPAINRKK